MSCDLPAYHSLDNCRELIRRVGDGLKIKKLKIILLKNDL